MIASRVSNKKLSPLFILIGLTLLLLFAFSVVQQQRASAYSPSEFLSGVNGRVVPNERPPRDDSVAAQAAGVKIGDDGASTALDQWYGEFSARKTKSGPNPIAYERRMAELAQAEALGSSPRALDMGELGTAKMLMIPFEFSGSDTLATCDENGDPVADSMVDGPLHGTIPDPALDGDNNTIWTDDFSIEWYEALMFGDGVGVVRTDLNDGAGVDLTGVSATNWYEEQSEGLYSIDGDIYPAWIQLDHSVAWYGWDGDELNPEGTGYPCDGTPSGYGFEFTIDVANKLNEIDPGFDWAQYDTDGDQIVDHLMVIHAGIDNSAGGGTYGNYQLWAHSWDVYCDKGDGEGLTVGCQVEGEDTPDDESDDIYIANYTHIPEDADIGVVVHEYGHDIGLPDYYDQTGATSNSTAQWIVMSGGSWSGVLGGAQPAPFNPWARYFFGWAEPTVIDYDDAAQMFTIGQSDPTPADTEDSVWINLPDQQVEIENMAGEGKGLHTLLGNNVEHSLTKEFDLSGTTTPVFTFTTYVSIEEDWDYTYVKASTDGGDTWTVLLNEEMFYGTENDNGTPAYQGVGGLTGTYEGTLTYDLSDFAGESSVLFTFEYVSDTAVQEPGMWVDNFSLDDGDTNLYSNDLEDSSDWDNTDGHGGPGWEEVPYSEFYPHYYMLEWRNDEGSIASVGHTQQYYSLAHDQDGWLVDKFSANVPGLLVWYRNNLYDNNQAVNGGREFAPPATGPKGELLLVDSHYEPVVWSGGWWDPTGGEDGTGAPAQEFSNRRGAMDGALTLDETPAWMIHDYADSANEVMDFGSRPAVSAFHDSMRSVPGWVFPGNGFAYRADQDASVVIAGAIPYTTRVRQLAEDGINIGDDRDDLWGIPFASGTLGSGNPGDTNSQYGVNVELVEAAEDGSWGKINVYNQRAAFSSSVDMVDVNGKAGSEFTLTYTTMVENTGTESIDEINVAYALDAALTMDSMSADVGTVDEGDGTWMITDLAAGETATLTVTATGMVESMETLSTAVTANDGILDLGPWFLDTDVNTYVNFMPAIFNMTGR